VSAIVTTASANSPAPLSGLPTPADAETIGPWLDDHGAREGEPRWFRRFQIHSRRICPGVTVDVRGEQFSDGTAVRSVEIGDIDLTPHEARELAAALIDAATRCEDGSRL
jgi:hypothetical protein